MKKLIIIAVASMLFYYGFGQPLTSTNKANDSVSQVKKTDQTIVKHYFDIGVGIGLDYSRGIGIKAIILPIPDFGILGSIGIGLGWEVGVVWNILPSSSKYHFRPNIKLMYGINGSIGINPSAVKNGDHDESYIGYTPGIGLEIMLGKAKRNGFDIDLSYPVHGQDYYDQLEYLGQNYHSDDFGPGRGPGGLPIQLSLGIHHEF